MIYLDTDVLIHFLVPQDISKYSVAKDIFDKVISSGKLKVSFLTMQETAYVLNRLGLEKQDIESILTTFLSLVPLNYEASEMRRAITLCKHLGFQHINDCLHTAIAERHCDELYTFNKADFKRIARLSKLKVVVLE
ncbi:Predicted nucleic acid-binding protein, contains PIN domain [Dyadobacter soli]|uniref:Predicted nucleic acid-binding protein, contains PIN domain n=1 Tax=Dyadobacter soli TaxID=659014 RepID=A0A1G7KW38_9BACT|nr:PIN domain-containing protein [Dyadobacter soli]SDF41331.1 Predicted nucleic acid-binding protein, contains PIN domain [Dyadobacter soli]